MVRAPQYSSKAGSHCRSAVSTYCHSQTRAVLQRVWGLLPSSSSSSGTPTRPAAYTATQFQTDVG